MEFGSKMKASQTYGADNAVFEAGPQPCQGGCIGWIQLAFPKDPCIPSSAFVPIESINFDIVTARSYFQDEMT